MNPTPDVAAQVPIEERLMRLIEQPVSNFGLQYEGHWTNYPVHAVAIDALAEIKKLRAKPPSVPSGGEWRPIAEAPMDGSDVLLFLPFTIPTMVQGRFTCGQWSVLWRLVHPSHFQALPSPPQAVTEGPEVGGCPDALLPDGPVCPRCWGRRAPSGVDGGSWVHLP